MLAARQRGRQRGRHGGKIERGSSFAEINGDENGDDEAEARWSCTWGWAEGRRRYSGGHYTIVVLCSEVERLQPCGLLLLWLF